MTNSENSGSFAESHYIRTKNLIDPEIVCSLTYYTDNTCTASFDLYGFFEAKIPFNFNLPPTQKELDVENDYASFSFNLNTDSGLISISNKTFEWTIENKHTVHFKHENGSVSINPEGINNQTSQSWYDKRQKIFNSKMFLALNETLNRMLKQ